MNEYPADKKILAVAEGLSMVDNDRDLYRTLIESFLTSIPFDAAHLHQLITNGQYDEAAKYLHLIKGAGRQIGAERMCDTAQMLEDMFRGKTETTEQQTHLLEKKLTSEYALVTAAIHDAVRQL